MMRTIAILVTVAALGVGSARADSEEPEQYSAFFDATLSAHPENPKGDTYLEGDSLTIQVDPTRLFPSPKTPILEFGFAADRAPPEVRGFYVTGPSSGRNREVLLQPGLCGLKAAKDEV